MQTLSHKARFDKYRDDTVIQKATQYAKWTLPQLMADLEITANSSTSPVLERDYQELGALLTNNLSAKLAGLLFPVNAPFFKIDVTPQLKELAEGAGMSDSDLLAGLARYERDACKQNFVNASYNQLVMALKHLIVTGNGLLYRDSRSLKTIVYGLQSYSVLRDGQGEVLDVVLREYSRYSSLSPEIQTALVARHPGKYKVKDGNAVTVELYTRIERIRNAHGDFYMQVTQQCDDIDVGTPGTYPQQLCPWRVLAWSLITGEHYGRGHVEDYAGGFAKLSDKSLALALYEINSLKVVNLVAPGAGADIDEIANAETGEYVAGSQGSVSAFESGEYQKIQAVRSEIQDTFSNLSKAFLYTVNNRDAERVTMYELRQAAQEAEVTLGGIYSSLAENMQIPLAHVLLTEVNPASLEGIVTGTIRLNISAGLPALSRASDVQSLVAAAQEAGTIIPVLRQVSRRIDTEKVLDLILAGQSVDSSLIFKSEAQLSKEDDAIEQQAQGIAQMQESKEMEAGIQQLAGMQQQTIV